MRKSPHNTDEDRKCDKFIAVLRPSLEIMEDIAKITETELPSPRKIVLEST